MTRFIAYRLEQEEGEGYGVLYRCTCITFNDWYF